jgi:hypothetical protein
MIDVTFWNHMFINHKNNTMKKYFLLYFHFSVFGGEKNDNNNRYLINPKCTEGLMSLMDTFLLSITCRGNIVLVSSSIEKHLGHCRVSVLKIKYFKIYNKIYNSLEIPLAKLRSDFFFIYWIFHAIITSYLYDSSRNVITSWADCLEKSEL